MKEVNIEIKKGKLIGEYRRDNTTIYAFKVEELQKILTLETKLNSEINNFIINNLGARIDIRLGKGIDLIMVNEMICALSFNGEIEFAEYYNNRFDGRELYLKETYGITKEELIEISKEEMYSRKLKNN